MPGRPLLRCIVRGTAAAAAVLFSLGAQAQLPEIVASKMAANNIPPDAISALVLRGDVPLISYLADRPMQPASTMKLVTTLVALDTLGPVFRGRTELRSTAPVIG